MEEKIEGSDEREKKESEGEGCRKSPKERTGEENGKNEVDKATRGEETHKGRTYANERGRGWKIIRNTENKKRKPVRNDNKGRSEGRADKRIHNTLNNAIIKKAIKDRGRHYVETKLKNVIDLKIKINYKSNKEELDPKAIVTELKRRLQIEDPWLRMDCKGREIREVGEIPADEFGEVFNIRVYERSGCVMMDVQITSSKKLKGLKHDNGGRLLKWLMEENMTLKVNMWKNVQAADIGFLVMSHPTVVWKEELKSEIIKTLQETLQEQGGLRNEMMTEEDDNRRKVPDFILYHDRKSFGSGPNRVHSTVTYVQCPQEDARTLKELLIASQKALWANLKLMFAPSGFHLSRSPKDLIQVLNRHNNYINSKTITAIIGLSEKAMNEVEVIDGESISLREKIRRAMGAERIEKTNRTEDLGKWLVMSDSTVVDKIKERIDEQLDNMVQQRIIKDRDFIPNIGWPRRTERSIKQRRYDEGIHLLQEELIGDKETGEEPVILLSDQTKRKPWQDRKRNTEKAKKSYAQAAKEGEGSEEPNKLKGNETMTKEGASDVSSTADQGLEKGRTSEEQVMQITQEDHGEEMVMEDKETEGVTKKDPERKQIRDALKELKEMRKRNDNILRRQEEDSGKLMSLQEQLQEITTTQLETLDSLKKHEEMIIKQGALMTNMISQLSQIQGVLRIQRKDNKKAIMRTQQSREARGKKIVNEQEVCDWDGGCHDEES